MVYLFDFDVGIFWAVRSKHIKLMSISAINLNMEIDCLKLCFLYVVTDKRKNDKNKVVKE